MGEIFLGSNGRNVRKWGGGSVFMVFHGSRWVFMVIQDSREIFQGSRSVFMVFKVPGRAFKVSHDFRLVFMVPC